MEDKNLRNPRDLSGGAQKSYWRIVTCVFVFLQKYEKEQPVACLNHFITLNLHKITLNLKWRYNVINYVRISNINVSK